MRLEQSLSFAAASLIFAGCFAPDGGLDIDTDTDAAAEGSTAEAEGEGTASVTTAEPTGGMTTVTPTSGTTTGEPTTSPTTDEPTTENPTMSGPTTVDTMDPTSGGDDPFCGDGHVDAGEECDDGLENNGLDQGCLPDCNLNVCGDGNIGPDEFCDDGEGDNILEVGACAPDCSTVIEEKVIRGSSATNGGNYQPNPVGLADGQCQPGHRALFGVPGVRQATANSPYTADDLIDWPLAPYTAYVRVDGTPIWTTDATPLLGVRDGAPEPLTNPVAEPCIPDFPNGVFCFTFVRPTGLNNDWTPALNNTCNGWSSNASGQTLAFGNSESSTEFLRGPTTTCDTGTGDVGLVGSWPSFYCVEQ
ncbi:MAG: DUF1554 domain-containing protein [Nannocystales bacterium]